METLICAVILAGGALPAVALGVVVWLALTAGRD